MERKVLRSCLFACAAAAAVVAAGWPGRASAQVTPKNATQNGNWSDASTWDPPGEPTATNDANINNQGPGTPTTVTIDQPGEVANFVNVGSVADQAGILNMTGGSLTTANTANSVLIGRVAGSTGTFTMSGGTIGVSMGGTGGSFRDIIIGDAGNATG